MKFLVTQKQLRDEIENGRDTSDYLREEILRLQEQIHHNGWQDWDGALCAAWSAMNKIFDQGPQQHLALWPIINKALKDLKRSKTVKNNFGQTNPPCVISATCSPGDSLSD